MPTPPQSKPEPHCDETFPLPVKWTPHSLTALVVLEMRPCPHRAQELRSCYTFLPMFVHEDVTYINEQFNCPSVTYSRWWGCSCLSPDGPRSHHHSHSFTLAGGQNDVWSEVILKMLRRRVQDKNQFFDKVIMQMSDHDIPDYRHAPSSPVPAPFPAPFAAPLHYPTHHPKGYWPAISRYTKGLTSHRYVRLSLSRVEAPSKRKTRTVHGKCTLGKVGQPNIGGSTRTVA